MTESPESENGSMHCEGLARLGGRPELTPLGVATAMHGAWCV